MKGFDTKGLGCLLEIQSAAFFKEWPRCEKAWLEAESGERADFGCLALTQVREPRARFAAKEGAAEQALHPGHECNCAVWPLEWFWMQLRHC